MTITRVQGNKRGLTASGSSLSITLDSTPNSGNLLIAVVGTYASTPPSVSSISQSNVTWTRQVQSSNSSLYGRNVEIWAGVVSASVSASLTINLAATGFVIADVCEYSGMGTNNFLDKTATTVGSYTRTLVTGTTATTTAAKELWVGGIFNVCDLNNGDNDTSPTNGFTLLDGIGYAAGITRSLAYLEKIVSSVGAASSGVTGGTYTTYEAYVGCIATFKSGDLEVLGDLTVNGNTSVGGTLSANTLSTAGNATVGGALSTTGNTTVGGLMSANTLSTSSNATVGGSLSANSLSTTENAAVGNALSANSLSTTGDATIGGNATVNNALYANQINPISPNPTVTVQSQFKVAPGYYTYVDYLAPSTQTSTTVAIESNLEVKASSTVDYQLILPRAAPILTNFQIMAEIYGYLIKDWQPHLNPRTDGVAQFTPSAFNLLSFKDTTGKDSNLFILNSPDDGIKNLLCVDSGFIVKKDIQAGGALFCSQGALLLGHGLKTADDPPKISLTHSDRTFPSSGADFPQSPMHNMYFFNTTLSDLYQYSYDETQHTWNWTSLPYTTNYYGSSPSQFYYWNGTTSTNAIGSSLPGSGAEEQCYIVTGSPNMLYQWHTGAWVSLGSIQNWDGGYDTLYITRGNAIKQYDISYEANQLANLKCNTLYVQSILDLNGNPIGVGNADTLDGYHASSFITSGSTPTFNGLSMNGNIIPTVANSYYCGSNAYPWQIVNTSYLYASAINALSGSTVNMACTLAFGSNPFTIASTAVIANLHAANSDALNGQTASYYLNASNINAGTLNANYISDLDASKITTGTFSTARIPNIFNQSLNTTNDGVFNSVKVISADGNPAHGAAVKVGDNTYDYIALNYDSTYGYVSAHNRVLYLSGDNGVTFGSSVNFNNQTISGLSILHSAISDWSSATSSFVTSGSSPTFSGITVSGNANIAGYAQFNNDARLSWVSTSTLAVQDSSGSTNNGGLDVGSIFVNNLQPLNSGSPAGININCPLSFAGSRGAAGQVLTSNGSGSTPTWQNSSSLNGYSFTAGAAVSANRIVAMSADNTVVTANRSNAQKQVGVAVADISVGNQGVIAYSGAVQVRAGMTLTAGMHVTTDDSGRAYQYTGHWHYKGTLNIENANIGAHNHQAGTTLLTDSQGGHSHGFPGTAATDTQGSHSHGFPGTAATDSQGSHSHGGGTGTSDISHTHGITMGSANTGTTSGHYHSYAYSVSPTQSAGGSHSHTLSSDGGHSHNVGGSTGDAGGHSHSVGGSTGSASSHSHAVGGYTGDIWTGTGGIGQGSHTHSLDSGQTSSVTDEKPIGIVIVGASTDQLATILLGA